jgi:ArsR family transcriptional regulator
VTDMAGGEHAQPSGERSERQPCTPRTLTQPLDRAEAESLSRLLKVAADATRLQLLSLISSSAQGEACVCDLTEPLGLRQPTVSHHLRVMREAGLVRSERRSTWIWYSLVPGALEALTAALIALGGAQQS